jgi:hypothetical protein
MKRRDPGLWLIPLSAVLFAIAFACGDNLEAPRAEPRSTGDALMCKSFEELMPRFLLALRQGRTENLRRVIKDHLLVPERPDEPPPINDTLRALFTTLTYFSKRPPERNAPAGELCAVTPPPLSEANEMCELRRALDLLVHKGQGIAALKLVQPQLSAILNYVIGKGVDMKPHDEVARVLAGQCAQDAECQLSSGLDLVIAFSKYLETSEGKKLLADIEVLTQGNGGDAGSILNLLNPNALTEDGLVGLSRVFLATLQAGTPADLDTLLNESLLAPYKLSLKPIVEDLKIVLDPKHDPNLIVPLRKVLNCVTRKDTNSDVVRMLYRLAIGPNKLPEFGFAKLTEVLNGVRDVDQRGALIHLVGTLASAIRNDEQAIDSSAKVCRTLLSTQTNVTLIDGGLQAQSNAQLALPVVADLLKQGIVSEAICAIDTLVYGCAGGAQPACAP